MKNHVSGHNAGIQSASAFRDNESKFRKDRLIEMNNVDPNLAGKESETIYRDKKGRKLDMLTELMKDQSIEESKKVKLNKAQFEWGLGTVQKKDYEERQRELAEVANEPFARKIDDPKLEAIRKKEVRDGDPMANYFEQKQAKVEKVEVMAGNKKNKVETKPKYVGPGAIPNRFGIRPGYRWDAIDRSNKFEQKLLKKMNDKKSIRDDEYTWSVSEL